MHPFAPHITAELWEGLRSTQRLPNDDYNYNKANWVRESVTLVDSETKPPESNSGKVEGHVLVGHAAYVACVIPSL